MRFRDWLTRVMSGRRGTDQLNRFLSIFTIVLLVLSLLLNGTAIGSLFWALGLVSLLFSMFRTFSRNMVKRDRENDAYLRLRGKVTGFFGGTKGRFQQRKDFSFFRCPSCRTWLRVPKGKGKVNITCRQCGERFIRKT